jgi:hypothetical protein
VDIGGRDRCKQKFFDLILPHGVNCASLSLPLPSESPRFHSRRRSSRSVDIGHPVLASQALMSEIISFRCEDSWTQSPATMTI